MTSGRTRDAGGGTALCDARTDFRRRPNLRASEAAPKRMLPLFLFEGSAVGQASEGGGGSATNQRM